MNIPTFELNNGVSIPAVGFGVYQTPPEQTIDAVSVALRTGIDTLTPPPRTATNGK